MSLTIRDATPEDIEGCLEIDARYQTDFVWQMNMQPDAIGKNILFRVDRLPRPMDVTYQHSPERMKAALDESQCFLVASTTNDDQSVILGYLTLRTDIIHHSAWIQDIVVSRPYQRRGIGSRLFNIAVRWAKEHDINHLVMETQTINYPSIEFCTKHRMVFCGYHDQYFYNGDIALFFAKSI
jgi:ribosomal protein S18 acetylase RimI-like enzyme